MSEKSGNNDKCVICGKQSIASLNKNNVTKISAKRGGELNKHTHIFSNWKTECGRTLCEILFGGDNHLFLYYFQKKDAYCSVCQQVSRDIHFTWRQITSLQIQLEKLSTILRKRLHGNYLNIEQSIVNDAIDLEEGQQCIENKIIIQCSLIDETDKEFFEKCSYKDVVTLIHKAASQVFEMTWPLSKDLLCSPEPSSHLKNSNIEPPLQDEANFNNLSHGQVKLEILEDVSDLQNTENNFENDYVKNDDGESEEESELVIGKARPKRKAAFAAHLKLKKASNDSEDSLKTDTNDDDDFSGDTLLNEIIEQKGSKDNSGVKSEVSTDNQEPARKNDRQERIKNGKVDVSNKMKSGKPVSNKALLVRAKKNAWIRKWRQNNERKDYVKKRSIKCTVKYCEATFKSEDAKQIHIKEVHTDEKKPFECSKCLKRFTRYVTLQKHLKDLHSGSRGYDHLCKFCGKGYSEEKELLSHYSSSHLGPNPFSCAFCDKVYSNTSDLRMHMQAVHPEGDRPKCTVCGKYFATKLTLEVHSLLHGDPNSFFKCTICNHVSATSARLKDHMERHDKEIKFTCEFCGKNFSHRGGLRCHMAVHSEEKKFKCKICGRGFAKSTGVKRHEVTHTGVKDHVCEICGRAFATRYNLTDHEKIHLREKGMCIPMRTKRPKKPPKTDDKEVDEQVQHNINMINSLLTNAKTNQEMNMNRVKFQQLELEQQQQSDIFIGNNMPPLPPLSAFIMNSEQTFDAPPPFLTQQFYSVEVKQFPS